ncbi:type ISP restriction/modification enzyme [Actinomadura sp. 21ATH]|uniref:type ISP restriction/modification enzyme n=1 Tax=Actinomadura sp. 21ATH TaxID=1735444 RepID=UPI0035BFDD19
MVEAAASRFSSVGVPGRSRDYEIKIVAAVTEFGAAVRDPLAAGIGGEEHQIQAPVAALVREAGRAFGLRVTTHAEVPLRELSVRPDFAVDIEDTTVGHIEVKAPSKSVNPKDWPARSHDAQQWRKLSLLPNLLLTNGQSWAWYRDGARQGPVARLDGALDRAGRSLRPADGEFSRALWGFLTWAPEPPRSLPTLVRTAARLCRYLREEVVEVMEHERLVEGDRPFSTLAEEWRRILFPRLREAADFADAYAQTVTFALLLARAAGVSFEGRDLPAIGRQLGKQHALIGRALGLLSDPTAADNLLVIETLRRVIGAVDWYQPEVMNDDAHALLYETFLEEYDPHLRRHSGSYYTPDRLAHSMVGFTDEILRVKLNRPEGYAANDVIVVDPAMGAGTFLVEIVNLVARTIKARQGEGALDQRLRDLFRRRLIGFERQVTPYAVAGLRLHELLKSGYEVDVPTEEMRFLADTFEDPDKQEFAFGSMYAELQRSRDGANKVKRQVPVMAVIGNPPYLDRAHTRDPAPWVEERRDPKKPKDIAARPSLDEFRQGGRLDYKLAATWVFFWRWAIWKAFEAHPEEPAGLVAFITPSSYLTGEAFAGMRSYLRRLVDEGWIIDVSPERHQPPARTRLFPKVQQPLAIAVFVRYGPFRPDVPARVHYRAVAGSQEEKFKALESLGLDSSGWSLCQDGWNTPFHPTKNPEWQTYPPMSDLMPWQTTGMRANRTWVIAPSAELLRRRWSALVNSCERDKGFLLKTTRDRDIDSRPPAIPGQSYPSRPLRDEQGRHPNIVPYSYRGFDRQYLILDPRVIDFPSSNLWRVAGESQIYVTEPHTNVIDDGPALTLAPFVPDVDHYQGHHGGRVLPLYRDAAGRHANLTPGLLEHLARVLKRFVTGEDILAYIAAVVAHSGYTRRYREDLVTPGVRVPITKDGQLWDRAVDLGRRIVWLHTYGHRFYGADRGELREAPRLPDSESPRIISPIPYTEDGMPETADYDRHTQTLLIGSSGRVAPVPASVWTYNVAGMRVVNKWIGYRLKNPRGRPPGSPLDLINATTWTHEFNDDLLDLLHVLGLLVRLEPRQAALLEEISTAPLVTVAELREVGILPAPKSAQGPVRPTTPDEQLAL